MKILIGLGNPGKKYANTYHNAGAIVLDKILRNTEKTADSIQKKKEQSFDFTKLRFGSETYIFARPKTFMNDSGLAVRSALAFFECQPKDMIIFHDDSDLALGAYKLSDSENAAGHHGLISIQKEIGVKSFRRVRIGIRDPKEKTRKKAMEFVLKNIPKTKLKMLPTLDLTSL